MFIKLKFLSTFIIIISLSLVSLAAETNKEKIETKQSGYWTYYCENLQKKLHCEIAQKIIIGEQKLTFLIIYKFTKNKNSKIKENFNVITPLGVNLNKRLKIIFDNKTKFTEPFVKCENFGCIAVFDTSITLKHSLENYENMKIIFYDFNKDKPNSLEVPIDGFVKALNAIEQQLKSFSF